MAQTERRSGLGRGHPGPRPWAYRAGGPPDQGWTARLLPHWGCFCRHAWVPGSAVPDCFMQSPEPKLLMS